jgi:hypothetical protein
VIRVFWCRIIPSRLDPKNDGGFDKLIQPFALASRDRQQILRQHANLIDRQPRHGRVGSLLCRLAQHPLALERFCNFGKAVLLNGLVVEAGGHMQCIWRRHVKFGHLAM